MKRKPIVLGIIFLLVLIALGLAFFYFSQPSNKPLSDDFKKKAIERMLGRQAVLTDITIRGESVFDGQNISFSYPSKAVIYEYREESSSKDESELDDFSFDIKNPRMVFNLKVYEANGMTLLSDFPAVKLRESRSEYKKEEFMLDGQKGIVFSNNSSQIEKSGFLIYQDKIITISITGSSESEISNLFSSIITSSKLK